MKWLQKNSPILRGVRRTLRFPKRYWRNRWYNKLRKSVEKNQINFEVGSPNWLVAMEIKFGGLQTNVPRDRVSPNDPRSEAEIKVGGFTGGDRMFHHRYAKYYSRNLHKYAEQRNNEYVVVEIGILKGSGLALWSELFPNARVIGLDIDISHCESNMESLLQRGAFKTGRPELYTFDQFVDGSDKLGEILAGQKIDIMIDDGFHSEETILNTFEAASPYLSDDFLYFIEDNSTVVGTLRAKFPAAHFASHKSLTVVTPK